MAAVAEAVMVVVAVAAAAVVVTAAAVVIVTAIATSANRAGKSFGAASPTLPPLSGATDLKERQIIVGSVLS